MACRTPGTTLETALHPLFHRQVFVRCKRSLVHLNRIVEDYKMLERLVYPSFSGK